MDDHNSSRNSTEGFIDDAYDFLKGKEAKETFKETIMDEISSSFKKEIHEFIMESIAPLKNSFSKDSYALESYNHKDLIHHMEKEIEFLRGELASKNRIIEMLLLQKDTFSSGNQAVDNQTKFDNTTSRKKDIKPPKIDEKEKEKITKRKKDKKVENVVVEEKREETQDQRSRKKVYIVGDSMLNGLKEVGFRKLKHDVKIRPHPGANTEDLVDHIKPILRRKNPDILIVHGGTNDLTSDGETTKNLETINRVIKKISPKTKLVISNCIVRKDMADGPEKVGVLNESLTKMGENMNLEIVEHGNISENNLSKGKLHLNPSGNSKLAQNFIKYIREIE